MMDREPVAALAVRQRPDSQLRSAMRSIFLRKKLRQFPVGGPYLAIDGIQHVGLQAFPVGIGNRGRELIQRRRESVGFTRAVGDAFALNDGLLQDVAGLHQPVCEAQAHRGDGVIQRHRNLLQSRSVVLVMLHRVERSNLCDFRQAELDAGELIDWHLPRLEVNGFDPVRQSTLQDRLIQPVRFGKRIRIDRFEARKEARKRLTGFRNMGR